MQFRFLNLGAPLKKRVAEILSDNPGLIQAELARAADVSKGLVTQWMDGTAKSMSYDAAKRLAVRFGYNLDWLLTGAGKKRGNAHNIDDGPEIRARVPLISWVQAGTFQEADDSFPVGAAEDWFPMPKRAGPHTYCLRVDGDSMTSQYGKSYPSGCIIFVDPEQRSPANGARVIAKLDGTSDVTFKTFVQESGRTFLRPLNPQYPPIYEAFKVIGTVIGKWEDD